ncbi:hypothetical protein CFOL_v3_15248, partial [Cephalotus follicularis]
LILRKLFILSSLRNLTNIKLLVFFPHADRSSSRNRTSSSSPAFPLSISFGTKQKQGPVLLRPQSLTVSLVAGLNAQYKILRIIFLIRIHLGVARVWKRSWIPFLFTMNAERLPHLLRGKESTQRSLCIRMEQIL